MWVDIFFICHLLLTVNYSGQGLSLDTDASYGTSVEILLHLVSY